MFLDVFWTLHDGAKVFGAKVYGQELQWLFTKYTLAACYAFASEFGRLWCNFVFLDVHDVFDNWFDSFSNNKLKPIFSAKLRFAFFWKLHVVLQQLRGGEECFGICEKFEMVLERLW